MPCNKANEAVYGELAQTIAQIINDNNETVKKRNKKEDVHEEVEIED